MGQDCRSTVQVHLWRTDTFCVGQECPELPYRALHSPKKWPNDALWMAGNKSTLSPRKQDQPSRDGTLGAADKKGGGSGSSVGAIFFRYLGNAEEMGMKLYHLP